MCPSYLIFSNIGTQVVPLYLEYESTSNTPRFTFLAFLAKADILSFSARIAIPGMNGVYKEANVLVRLVQDLCGNISDIDVQEQAGFSSILISCDELHHSS